MIATRAQKRLLATRLKEFMQERGLTQSDLARKIWGETTNSEGYTVARNRDRISVWMRGAAYPDVENLRALAKALGKDVQDLAPTAPEPDDVDLPEQRLDLLPNRPGWAFLQINKIVPLPVATEVLMLLSVLEGERDPDPAPVGPAA